MKQHGQTLTVVAGRFISNNFDSSLSARLSGDEEGVNAVFKCDFLSDNNLEVMLVRTNSWKQSLPVVLFHGLFLPRHKSDRIAVA